jgi:hypothetical protein
MEFHPMIKKAPSLGLWAVVRCDTPTNLNLNLNLSGGL